ncbi:MAG: hypothetical protein ACD_29C00143G0003 [uncultured bacterium]|nr:MAG: hypothetical protein ACD_29C00143G0003 [uncultured bacterium]
MPRAGLEPARRVMTPDFKTGHFYSHNDESTSCDAQLIEKQHKTQTKRFGYVTKSLQSI